MALPSAFKPLNHRDCDKSVMRLERLSHLGFAGALTFIDAALNCRLTNLYPYSVRPDHE